MTQPFGAGTEDELFNDYSESMARTAAGRVERYLLHAAHVDPDHWQNPARTHAATKSLVEYNFVCHTKRTYDIH